PFARKIFSYGIMLIHSKFSDAYRIRRFRHRSSTAPPRIPHPESRTYAMDMKQADSVSPLPPEQHLPEVLVRLHVFVRGADLGKREDGVDQRAQSPLVEERQPGLAERLRHRDLLLERPRSEHRPDQGQPLAEEEPEIELRPPPGDEPHDRHPPARRQRPEIPRKVGAAHQIADHVDAVAPGLAADHHVESVGPRTATTAPGGEAEPPTS